MSDIAHLPNDIAIFSRPKSQLSELQSDVNSFTRNKRVWSIQLTSSGNDVIVLIWLENL